MCRAFSTFLAFTLGFWLLAGSAAAQPGSDGSATAKVAAVHGPRWAGHRSVLITDERLHPRSIRLDAGELVAWISYSEADSFVRLDAEAGRGMICHRHSKFTVRDGALQSAPIRTGEYASLCQLEPGRYPYEVVREGRPSLRGEILVDAPR